MHFQSAPPINRYMIVLWTGAPGSGKSYSSVNLIVEALQAGKYVGTNVELVDGWALQAARGHWLRRLMPGRVARTAAEWQSRCHVTHDLEELFRLRMPGRKEGRGVMVLDEAHNWVNARTWDTDETGQQAGRAAATLRRLKVVKFFTQHRKLGWDVYLITQSAETIDAQIRRLFEFHVVLRNLKRARPLGLPVVPINLFLAIWRWNDTGGSVTRRQVFRLRRRYARLYDSLALSHGLDDADRDALWFPHPGRPAGGTAQAVPAGDPEGKARSPEPVPPRDRPVVTQRPRAAADGQAVEALLRSLGEQSAASRTPPRP